MAPTIRRVLPCLFLLVAALLNAETSSQPAEVQITLGQAIAPLYGPWKFTIGDSPTDPRTGKPLWAEPDFDDSHWETVDLAPKQGAIDPNVGTSGYAPGWTARGHAGYFGYAWYRIRVRCQGQNGQPLGLLGPANVDDVYQVFSDGELLGGFGDFTRRLPVAYSAKPFMFQLPERRNELNGTRVLAFRLWMDPATLVSTPDVGGMHDPPLLGDAGIVALDYQSNWVELLRAFLAFAFSMLVFGLLAVVAFTLILFDRSDPAYFWIGLLFLAILRSTGGRKSYPPPLLN